MKIQARVFEGEPWIKLSDHKADVERYKERIRQLEASDSKGKREDALLRDFFNLGKAKP